VITYSAPSAGNPQAMGLIRNQRCRAFDENRIGEAWRGFLMRFRWL
jgi:hypothetical protein